MNLLHRFGFPLLLALTACGSPSASTDASAPTDASPDASTDAAPASPDLLFGEIRVLADTTLATGSVEPLVYFYQTHARDGGVPVCRTRVEGACRTVVCDRGPNPLRDSVSVGPVTISGGDGTSITLPPNAMNIYSTAPVGMNTDGFTFTIHTDTTTTLPGLDVQYDVPAAFVVTQPQARAAFTLDRSVPFDLTWLGGDGDVEVQIEEEISLGGIRWIRCVVPAGDHATTVPVSLLSDLLPSPMITNSKVRLIVAPVHSHEIVMDGVYVLVTVANDAYGGLVPVQ